MFTIDPKITEKDLKGKNIFKVLLSMNSHQVATPDTSLEEARSYVFFFHEGRNRLSAYIGLHLLVTDRKLIYRHSANPFLENEQPEIEDEARDFAEYLGAMMDEVNFEAMSDLEQDSWIENQGIFSTKKRQESVPAEQSPPPEVAASAPQPPAAPEQPAPEAESKSRTELPTAPVQPASVSAPVQAPAPAQAPASATVPASPLPVQPLPKIYPAELKEQPGEASVAKTVKPDVRSQALSPLEETTRSREPAQKEATPGIETPPKQAAKRISFSATSVVSRDKEALARLLTSF